MTQFLLQMAGVPGSGKSALARLIGSSTGAVVIDKDVIKTALLESGADEALAAPGAYEAFFALASHLLGQDLSVVLDSPSFYESIPANGATIAGARCVPYYFIECACADLDELARRLRDRSPMRSQQSAVERDSTTVPPPGAYLRIDTTQPLEHCLDLALDYLGAG